MLLRHLWQWDKTQFYVNLNREVAPEQIQTLNSLIQRRIRHEPIAYITEHKEFFGIEFYLDSRVIIPRPETELLVEQALKLASSRFPRSCIIADIGTGCGAIAIALASNLIQARVYATDISAPALEVAAINCHRHSVTGQVQLLQGDLLDPVPEPVHLVVANLPYVRDSEIAELSAESRLFEPMIALAGGEDGLEWIRKLLSQAGGKISPDGAILIEIGYDQGLAVVSLAREAFPEAVIRIVPDLSGHDRVVIVDGGYR